MFAVRHPRALASARQRIFRPPPPHYAGMGSRQMSMVQRVWPFTPVSASGKSMVGTFIALAGMLLYAQPDLRREVSREATHWISSFEWGTRLCRRREAAYVPITKLPADYNGEQPKKGWFGRTLPDPEPETSKIRIKFQEKEFFFDLIELDKLGAQLKKSLNEFLENDLDSTTKRLIKEHSPNQVDATALPFAHVPVGNRVFAWLIDSAFVGLLAAPFWRLGLYGPVAGAAWLFKDYLLAPLGLSSPGYQFMGLEVMHLRTAQDLRPVGWERVKVDGANVLDREMLSVMGHNALRFFTWGGSLGIVSNVVTLGWIGFAMTRGIDGTVAAWDKFTGVQVVRKADLEVAEKTGKIPYRPESQTDAMVRVDLDLSGRHETSVVQGNDRSEYAAEVALNGEKVAVVAGVESSRDSQKPDKLVFARVRDGNRKEHTIELPMWITTGSKKSSSK